MFRILTICTASAASVMRALARMTSPKRRLRSEKVHSTFHLLPYPISSFHWSLPTSTMRLICLPLAMQP